VKFVVKHDRAGAAFRFAPLRGETFQATVPVDQRAGLPDSMVVQTQDGSLLVRSDALVHILRRLPGRWKALAAYDFIARIRYRVFGQRDDLCPDVPPQVRERFDP
jgi:predicted DCC family thiol-disulfide oxidoreductase YuxK